MKEPGKERIYSISSASHGRGGYGSSVAVLVVVAVVVAALSGFGGGWIESRNQSGVVNGNLTSQKKIVTSESRLINQIAKTVGPSVVSVNVNIGGSDSSGQSN